VADLVPLLGNGRAVGVVASVDANPPATTADVGGDSVGMPVVVSRRRISGRPGGPDGVTVLSWSLVEVRALRAAVRLSVREFAVYLGVSDRQVSKWEAGAVPRPTRQAMLDTVLRQADIQVQRRFVGLVAATAEDSADDTSGWEVHLLVEVPDLTTASAVADEICLTLAARRLPVLLGATTVSPADDQSVRYPVYCDLRLDGGTRCGRRHGHKGVCHARPPVEH
jgi:transcriptional regulator with XRE-family HTH domain